MFTLTIIFIYYITFAYELKDFCLIGFIMNEDSIIKTILVALENYWVEFLISACVSFVMIFVGKLMGWIKFQFNLRKPLFLFELDFDNLKRIEEVLISKDFKISNRSSDLTSLDDFRKKNSILIVGYSENKSDKLKNAVNKAKSLHQPIIIFCSGNCVISKEDKDIICSYTYYEICNSPFRLILTINNVCQNY